MTLFDSLIKEVNELLKTKEYRVLPLTEELLEDVGKNNMVFSDEMAYELGGDNKNSLSFELSTSNSSLLNDDEIILFGDDLYEIKENREFIRITLLNVEDEKLSGEQLYSRLETIKFTKYRVSPKGYMLRTSSSNKEKVRISKNCAKCSFSNIGSAYIKAYKLIPAVKSVKILFITGESGLYEPLKQLAIRKNEITDTIDHILKGMILNDCGSCSAKEICDEVEGLRQLHQRETNGN